VYQLVVGGRAGVERHLPQQGPVYERATRDDDVDVSAPHDFWEGIVELLTATEAATLEGRFSPDPEAGAFFASGND
jgi:hypothetical protein